MNEMNMNDNPQLTEDMLEQARTWYVRLGSEQASGKDWENFTQWLEESSLHVDAYDQVELALADIPSVHKSVADVDNVVSLDTARRTSKPSFFGR
jgi:ferric-dicitrate binding protein FerR (iron transport regulator)